MAKAILGLVVLLASCIVASAQMRPLSEVGEATGSACFTCAPTHDRGTSRAA
jgi:hypothetical protein